ncbi:MAG: hypothetical protein QHH75_10865 [Bacillota bacterium]|nr:hypothetical protein [Bacillota bacterium]
MKRLNIAERLALNKFEVDHEEPHILLKRELCRTCTLKPRTFVCPAGRCFSQLPVLQWKWVKEGECCA